ncbi:hypothetical protein DBR24_05205 [Pseudomonas sp. HMWF006]|nr:hypothetical protein DBR24_05205 [Pseudomonas sp. HMWF006]PTT91690.1 hypothetical protein DBR29_10830 [Pseudomonas sp. HMWF005]
MPNETLQSRDDVNLLSESSISLASNKAIVADGVIKDIAAQSFETVSNGWAAVAAKNGGVISAENVDAITRGSFANAVQASGNDSVINFNGGSVTTEGYNARAVYGQNGGTVNVGRDSNGNGTVIRVNGDSSSAIAAAEGMVNVEGATIFHEGGVGAINYGAAVAADGNWVIKLDDTKIQITGNNVSGLSAGRAGASIDMTGGSITTVGANSRGALAFFGGNLSLQDVAISTQGTRSLGLIAGAALDGVRSQATVANGSLSTFGSDSSAVQANEGGDISLSGTAISTTGERSHGLNSNFGGAILASSLNVETAGQVSNGAYVNGAGTKIILNNGVISTLGRSSNGVLAASGGAAQITNMVISTVGDVARGLVANGDGSTIVADRVKIDTSGSQSYGLFANGSNSHLTLTNSKVTTSGFSSHGASVFGGGGLLIQSSDIQAHGNGLTINNGGVVKVEGSNVASVADSSAISSWGADARNTFEVNNSKLSSVNGSAIKVRGDGNHDFLINSSTVEAASGLLFNINPNADGSLSSGSSNLVAYSSILDGDINTTTDPEFNANFSLQNATHWTGAGNGINQLSLNGESVWSMTNDSSVKSLGLQDGRVEFQKVPGQFRTLTAGALAGNGEFFMNVDLANLKGDSLVVTDANAASGSHMLIIEDSGLSPHTDNEKLMVVDTNGGNGNFNLYGGHIDAGAFRYTLGREADDWYLISNAKDPEHPEAEDLSKGANAAVASHTASALMLTSQMDSLVKRLGELRMGKDEGGAWTRAIGKRLDVGVKSSRAYTQNVNGIEIGADKAIHVQHGKVYVGGMVGAASSDLNFGEGSSGKIDSRMVGAYATYIDEGGIYLDGVIKYNRLTNEVKTPTNLGAPVKGAYNTNGIGLSVEVGKHIKLNDGWFVEPQLAISTSRIQGASYSSSNSLEVKADNIDSLQSRVGSLFGRSLQFENGMDVQPYVKASYITEHAGKSKVVVDGDRLDADLQGNRMELGFGGTLKVSENSKISLDAEYAKGNSIEQPWGVNLGYRYTW